MTLLYPFIHWYPTKDKPFTVRLFPYFTPVIYPFIIPGQLVIRCVLLLYCTVINQIIKPFPCTSATICFRTFKRKNDIADVLMFVIPAILTLCGQMTIISIIIAWLIIVLTSSFIFTFVGFSASHHFPENFHDGDLIK
jgi:hypothetical protein